MGWAALITPYMVGRHGTSHRCISPSCGALPVLRRFLPLRPHRKMCGRRPRPGHPPPYPAWYRKGLGCSCCCVLASSTPGPRHAAHALLRPLPAGPRAAARGWGHGVEAPGSEWAGRMGMQRAKGSRRASNTGGGVAGAPWHGPWSLLPAKRPRAEDLSSSLHSPRARECTRSPPAPSAVAARAPPPPLSHPSAAGWNPNPGTLVPASYPWPSRLRPARFSPPSVVGKDEAAEPAPPAPPTTRAGRRRGCAPARRPQRPGSGRRPPPRVGARAPACRPAPRPGGGGRGRPLPPPASLRRGGAQRVWARRGARDVPCALCRLAAGGSLGRARGKRCGGEAGGVGQALAQAAAGAELGGRGEQGTRRRVLLLQHVVAVEGEGRGGPDVFGESGAVPGRKSLVKRVHSGTQVPQPL